VKNYGSYYAACCFAAAASYSALFSRELDFVDEFAKSAPWGYDESPKTMTGSYNYHLVALSVLIAVCASYAALELAGRTTAASGRLRLAWLACGATAMGLGIWSMHYIGMLAFSLPIPVLYHWPTVVLSLLAAVFASAVALFVVSRKQLGWPRALVGSAIMGSGIATMHYTGMAAMRLSAMCSYEPLLLTLSVVFAIVISLAAIWLTFHFREEARASAGWKVGCAIVMGAAIPVMHYTGMAAARFTPSSMVPDTAHAVSTSTLGFTGVSSVTLLVLGVAVLTSAVDRRFAAQRLQLDASEQRYQSLIEGVRDYAIFMLTPDGHVASWNLGAERTKGYRANEIVGRHFSCFYPEEDIRDGKPERQLMTATAEGRVEDEGWRVRKDGSRFWASVVVTALRDDEGRLQGFSRVTRNITERKRAEDSVRELSGRLLQIQDEERRHFARELHDSAGQMLAALSMNLAPLETEASKIGPNAANLVRESVNLVGELSKQVRTISHLLHPPLLDEVGLSSALRLYVEGFAERSKIAVDLEIPSNFGRLSRDWETTIFRIVQESLTNIHRHSGSQVARIHVYRSETEVRVEVQDAGTGISPQKRSEMESTGKTGVGIRGMRERLRQLGGTLEIDTVPDGTGAIVIARLPIVKATSMMQTSTDQKR
jgi:PAS domain S-box-containing protein